MVNNTYYMGKMSKMSKGNAFLKIVASKTSFRTIKKGGFCTTKKDFKVKSMSGRGDRLLRDDGSVIVPNNYNKGLYKRLRRFYPMY